MGSQHYNAHTTQGSSGLEVPEPGSQGQPCRPSGGLPLTAQGTWLDFWQGEAKGLKLEREQEPWLYTTLAIPPELQQGGSRALQKGSSANNKVSCLEGQEERVLQEQGAEQWNTRS